MYTNAMTDTLYGRSSGTVPRQPARLRRRLRRPRHHVPLSELPRTGTLATNDDGTPMHDWWVYLFY